MSFSGMRIAATISMGSTAGTSTLASAILPTGAVRFTVNQGLYLGELPAGQLDRVQTLATLLERAGIVAHVTPSIQSLEWSKYVMFLCLMAPAVLTRCETYKFLQDPHTASVVASILHEMAALATRQGIPLEDIALFPALTLSHLPQEDTVTALCQRGEQFAARVPTHKMSTLQDLEQGKRLEVKETLGYAVRQSAALGIPTPTMDVCYKLIAGINHYLH